MKKFKKSFWVAIIVAFCTVSLAWATTNTRQSFNLLNVTIVKITENQVTVRNSEGKLLVLEVTSELRANQSLRNFRIGDKVRIQIQGNALFQVQQR